MKQLLFMILASAVQSHKLHIRWEPLNHFNKLLDAEVAEAKFESTFNLQVESNQMNLM